MANSYASLYLSDVLNKVKSVALDTMMALALVKDKDLIGGDTICEYNERIAIYNDGIRDLAQALKHAITEMTEEEEK